MLSIVPSKVRTGTTGPQVSIPRRVPSTPESMEAVSAVVKLLLQIDTLRSYAIRLIFELMPDGGSKSR